MRVRASTAGRWLSAKAERARQFVVVFVEGAAGGDDAQGHDVSVDV